MSMSSHDLQFLARFSKSPEGTWWLRHLEARLASANEALMTADGNAIYRKQGEAKILLDLCRSIAEADQRLERAPASSRTR